MAKVVKFVPRSIVISYAICIPTYKVHIHDTHHSVFYINILFTTV